MSRRLALLVVFATVALAAAIGADAWLQRAGIERDARALTGGDPARGRERIRHYGCIACHDIPGFAGTAAHVGPPLDAFALRSYVAGVAENTPGQLEHFLRDPPAVAPHSAMPKLDIDDRDARDLAAFLYTLR